MGVWVPVCVCVCVCRRCVRVCVCVCVVCGYATMHTCVRVPVLSDAMTVVQPSVSTPCSVTHTHTHTHTHTNACAKDASCFERSLKAHRQAASAYADCLRMQECVYISVYVCVCVRQRAPAGSSPACSWRACAWRSVTRPLSECTADPRGQSPQ